ncbi:MAG: recN [Acidimicrobiaceae bacterium]|nr:recN [Acidimicrobiaceae bacterium]
MRELGVIADLHLVLEGGMTALTGETGAGKTLVVEALELLLGGRADPTMVRAGADEAVVEGRFADGDEELVLSRAVPAQGRSRATRDGAMVPLSALEELGQDLVDLYGQHAHQSLLRPSTQREALDRFSGVDLSRVQAKRRRLAELDGKIAELGGDDRQRRRELDLLRFELAEIEAARIASESEESELALEEERLAAASALREASFSAYDLLAGDGGAAERVGEAIEVLSRLPGVEDHLVRLRSLAADAEDAASELRLAGEGFEEDPERLAEVRARRHLLRGLVRKHGEELADVINAGEAARSRIAELESGDVAREAAEAERAEVAAELAAEEQAVGDVRRAAAPRLAAAVEEHLRQLALPRAHLEVRLPGHGLADEVEVLLAANPGEPPLPLAKAASGGELARAMLALRLVLTSDPGTLVFDEVDAGIGGEAAVAVGRSLAELARDHQVLVVTHLPQVAAFASHHFVVTKGEEEGRTVTRVRLVEGDERVAELSRMLAGRPGSEAARRHAEELLAEAASG